MKNIILSIPPLLSCIFIFLVGCTKVIDPEENPLGSLIVEAQWLSEHLNDDNLVLIDARGFPAKNDSIYKTGHIKGAINANYAQFATPMTDPKVPGWANILPPGELGPKLASFGIDQTKIIVVYADNDAADPARFGQDGCLVWTFRMAGLKNSKILNGGYRYWVARGYPTETTVTAPTPTSFTVASLDQSYTVTTAYIKSNLKASMVIIDSRTLEEYKGAPMYGAPRDGHYPGAVHFFFANMLNADNTFKTADQMESLLSGAGFKKSGDIVIYCTSGIRSAHLTMVMRTLGYENAKNHDDSFMVWASDSTLPLEILKKE